LFPACAKQPDAPKMKAAPPMGCRFSLSVNREIRLRSGWH
jgi:hypothetical protein